MKPLLPDLMPHLVHDQYFDEDGRLVIIAPSAHGGTDRIVYDPKKDWWESDGSAGWGWEGLIARLWNRQDGGPFGGLDVLHYLTEIYGQAALLDFEKQSSGFTTYSSSEEADLK